MSKIWKNPHPTVRWVNHAIHIGRIENRAGHIGLYQYFDGVFIFGNKLWVVPDVVTVGNYAKESFYNIGKVSSKPIWYIGERKPW